MAKQYRVSDVTIDAGQSVVAKQELQRKLNALVEEGWTVEDIGQVGDFWFVVSAREAE